MKVLFIALLGLYGFSVVQCEDDHFEDGVYKEAIAFVMECSSQDVGLCLKERALKYIDRLPANMDIGGAIKIKQLDAERAGKHFNPLVLPEEPRAREEAVNNALFDKIAEYLSSHTVEFRLPSESVKDMQRSMMVDEGRKKQGGGGGGKKGGGGMKMMMMLGMKGALLGALALKFIALIAFKALVIAKIAFTISAIIALKKLLGGKQQSSTYEVVAHPHYEEHGGGHYDRSFGPELAYRGHPDPKVSHISY